MTREEAIDWLARLKSNTVNHTLEMPLWWNEPLADALDMAIKALNQEPILDKIQEEIKRVNCANQEIREAIERKRIKYWELAKALGINNGTLSKWLRTELSPEKKEKILKAIEDFRY